MLTRRGGGYNGRREACGRACATMCLSAFQRTAAARTFHEFYEKRINKESTSVLSSSGISAQAGVSDQFRSRRVFSSVFDLRSWNLPMRTALVSPR